MESWLEGTENRIRRPQKFRWHGREPQQKTRPHWSGCQRSARKCLRPSPPLLSPSLLNFLCILRQGLTVEPQIALISGSPPAASAFQVLGLQEWAAIPGLAVPLLSHSSLPCSPYVSAPPTGTLAQSPLSPPALYVFRSSLLDQCCPRSYIVLGEILESCVSFPSLPILIMPGTSWVPGPFLHLIAAVTFFPSMLSALALGLLYLVQSLKHHFCCSLIPCLCYLCSYTYPQNLYCVGCYKNINFFNRLNSLLFFLYENPYVVVTAGACVLWTEALMWVFTRSPVNSW